MKSFAGFHVLLPLSFGGKLDMLSMSLHVGADANSPSLFVGGGGSLVHECIEGPGGT